MKDIETLAEVHEALQSLGYRSTLRPGSVAVRVGGRKHPFPAVVTHNTLINHFQITCQVARMGDVPEDKLAAFALAALDANNRTSPFAYALITDTDDPALDDENEWPLVLVAAFPIGDFSVRELSTAMQRLLAALLDARSVLELIKDDAPSAVAASGRSGGAASSAAATSSAAGRAKPAKKKATAKRTTRSKS
jgi:hypothetical protein